MLFVGTEKLCNVVCILFVCLYVIFLTPNCNQTEWKYSHTVCQIGHSGVKGAYVTISRQHHREGVARRLAFLPILGRVLCCVHCLSLSNYDISVVACLCNRVNVMCILFPVGYHQPPEHSSLAAWHKLIYLVLTSCKTPSNQLISQSVSQSISRSIDQSISQSVNLYVILCHIMWLYMYFLWRRFTEYNRLPDEPVAVSNVLVVF